MAALPDGIDPQRRQHQRIGIGDPQRLFKELLCFRVAPLLRTEVAQLQHPHGAMVRCQRWIGDPGRDDRNKTLGFVEVGGHLVMRKHHRRRINPRVKRMSGDSSNRLRRWRQASTRSVCGR
jgi:hypothetical protein